jgi:hypothetical protein
MALSATLLLELQFLHKSSVRRIQFRQWPTCHFTKRPFGTSCDNIRNVHVGSKNENPERTGLLIFRTFVEGTENIKRGEWFKIVTGNGGTNNANTSDDTYYYEVFPSNNLELGLWMEAERMMHPVINQIGLTPKTKLLKKKDCV